jgi:uncharacterized membrane protein YqjE
METGTPRDPGQASPPPADPLPPGGSRFDRVSEHGQALFENFKEWIEWRIELARIEAQERIDREKQKLTLIAIAGVLGALAGFFALTALALAIGWVFGHPFWGFLILFVLLSLGALIFFGAYQSLVQEGESGESPS